MTAPLVIRPSGAWRWLHCPGAPTMASKFPRSDDGVHSQEGRAAHLLAQACLDGGTKPGAFAGRELGGIILTSEVVNSVSVYVTAVRQVLGTLTNPRQAIEHKLTIEYLGLEGTLDALLWDHTAPTSPPHLFDFKHGRRFVDAADNYQGLCYMIGLAALVPQAPGFNLTIVQPRNFDADGPVRSCYYPIAEIETQALRMRDAIAQARGSNPRCQAGPWCYKCEGAHACPAFSRSVSTWYDFTEAATPQELSGSELGLEIELVKAALEALENREAALISQAEVRLAKGETVQGWRAVDSWSRVEWSGDPIVLAGLLDLAGIDARKPLDLITPKQALDMGADPDVVSALSSRHRIGTKLERDNLTREKRAFA